MILGLDFLERTQMTLNLPAKTFEFVFAPERVFSFGVENPVSEYEPFLQELCVKVADLSSVAHVRPKQLCEELLREKYPRLFSSSVGTAKCVPYENELSDTTPVRSPPYRCAPPKLQKFKKMVNELLEQGVVRPSKSQSASTAFLIAKNNGGSRLVVDYKKVNVKVVFDSYALPTIDKAFEQFNGAVVFSALDLNSAYFQIQLSARSRRVTVFCTPFGLIELSKLPMGISVGSQGLSRVVDELFVDLRGDFVFNYLEDEVIYSCALEDHARHVRVVLYRLQSAAFTLNFSKFTIAASEIEYLGYLLSSRGISVLPDRVAAINSY